MSTPTRSPHPLETRFAHQKAHFRISVEGAVHCAQGAELLFYGDSITWCFTGENPTGVQNADDKARAAIFQRHFGRFRSQILAIPGTTNMLETCTSSTTEGLLRQSILCKQAILTRSWDQCGAAGDQSANLMWRIMDGGEFPTIHMPRTVVILIGTNDLTFADCHDDQQEILNAAPGVVDRFASPGSCFFHCWSCGLCRKFPKLCSGCICESILVRRRKFDKRACTSAQHYVRGLNR